MFEFFLVLYLFSGICKGFFLSAGISLPVDFTLLTGFFVFLTGIQRYLNSNSIFKFLRFPKRDFIITGLLVVFFLWSALTVIWSPQISYPKQKIFYFLTNLLPFIMLLFVRNLNIRYFSLMFTGSTFLFAIIYFVLSPNARYYQDPEWFTLDYIVLSGFGLSLSLKMGVAAITSLYLFRNKILAITGAYFFVFMSFYAGARGTTIIILLVFIVLLFFHLAEINARWLKPAGLKIIGISLIAIVVLQMSLILLIKMDSDRRWTYDRAVFRTLLLFDAVDDSANPESIDSYLLKNGNSFKKGSYYDIKGLNKSVISRMWHILFVKDELLKNKKLLFAGAGFGSYGYLCCEEDAKMHPHNILLEIWFETGLVGLLLFMAFVFLIMLRIRIIPWAIMIFGCVFFLFLNSMKSSSVIEIRDFFTFAAILAFSSLPSGNEEI